MVLRLLPVVLSLIVLGAHFLRSGGLFAVLVIAILIALVFVRKPWAARILQLVLVLGAIEWILTLSNLAAQRMQTGEPAGRMVMILGTVALFTGLSALAFRGARARAHYGFAGSDEQAEITE